MSRELLAQRSVLESLLNGAALPGRLEPLAFPDVPDLTDSTPILLVDEREPADLDFPARLRVVRPDELEGAVTDSDAAVVLEFLQPEAFPGKVGVRLRVSRSGQDQRLSPLGEIVATFEDSDDLTSVDPTHVLAY